MGNTVIQLRNDTSSNWTTNNPTLALGEMGLETDTNKFKFGDGTTAWNSLTYAGGSAGSFKYGLYTISTSSQTSNISAGNHVEFNTSAGSLGGLSTGTGQQQGIITLSAGKTYKITGSLYFNHSSSSGYTNVRLYDRTNSAYFGSYIVQYSTSKSTNYSSQPTILAIITPSTSIDIEARFETVSSTNAVSFWSQGLLIEEYGGY